ncbi:lactonase family protein [Photobacterium lutimaris]|uniref:6-phosphogluconolactonase n=1 Tax=Photobacterium lutimaris TaxID=388278 RepID=A0A2T3J5E2_9GAMM|nr:lactonase family protein [Photobacterium lutimaris]PSU36509.1 6-phosphogluconolactonase [Photobacterium lutimaris]TDR74848.1 6-phosphogluconolactonase [Photobacterium lutimaris]
MTTLNHLHFYVGTYTDTPSTSEGIAHITLDPMTGEITRQNELVSLRNPSYLTTTSKGLYSFSEISQQEGAALQFSSRMGNIYLPIAGDFPCHLDIKNPYLAVANYGSGNVVVYLIDEDGRPLQAIADLYEGGNGPNKDRQLSPHAHQVTFLKHSNQLAIVDLGSDRIRFYDCDTKSGKHTFTLGQSIAMPAGSGPRHLVFNQYETHAYVVCELSETLVVLTKTDGIWAITHQCELLSNAENGEAASAVRLSADERFLYVSCRAQNKICAFDVSSEEPVILDVYDCQGQFPRDFAISENGQWLIVANQHSNTIASFKRSVETGEITPTGYQCSVDAPVCLAEVTH